MPRKAGSSNAKQKPSITLHASSSSRPGHERTPPTMNPASSTPSIILKAPSSSTTTSTTQIDTNANATANNTNIPKPETEKKTLPFLPPKFKSRKWQKSPSSLKLLSGVELPVSTWYSDEKRELSTEQLIHFLKETNVAGYNLTMAEIASGDTNGPSDETIALVNAGVRKKQAEQQANMAASGGLTGYTNNDMAYANFVDGRGIMFKCDRIGCYKEFTKVESLRKHISLAHPDSQPCPVCQRRFASHSKLVKHVKGAHNMLYQEDGTVANIATEG